MKVMTNGDLARLFHTRAAALADDYKANAQQNLAANTHMHALADANNAGDPPPSPEQIAAIVDGFMSRLDGIATISIMALCRTLVTQAQTYAVEFRSALIADPRIAAAGMPTQDQVDAVLVGLVNHFAMEHCVDLALYARDITPNSQIASGVSPRPQRQAPRTDRSTT